MLHVVFDSARDDGNFLFILRNLFPNGKLLLDQETDGNLEYVAPWIFPIQEIEMDTFKSLDIPSQNLLWLESSVILTDIIKEFKAVIYNDDIKYATSFFRCWDLQVLMEHMPKNTQNIQRLFKVIDHFYLISDQLMQKYYLDNWGVLNAKTVQNILQK